MNMLKTIAKIAQGAGKVTLYMVYDIYNVELSLCGMVGCLLVSALIYMYLQSALLFVLVKSNTGLGKISRYWTYLRSTRRRRQSPELDP